MLELPAPTLTRFIVLALAVPALLIVTMTLTGAWIAVQYGLSALAGGLSGFVLALLGGAVLARVAGNKLTKTGDDQMTRSIIAYTPDGHKIHTLVDAQDIQRIRVY